MSLNKITKYFFFVCTESFLTCIHSTLIDYFNLKLKLQVRKFTHEKSINQQLFVFILHFALVILFYRRELTACQVLRHIENGSITVQDSLPPVFNRLKFSPSWHTHRVKFSMTKVLSYLQYNYEICEVQVHHKKDLVPVSASVKLQLHKFLLIFHPPSSQFSSHFL